MKVSFLKKHCILINKSKYLKLFSYHCLNINKIRKNKTLLSDLSQEKTGYKIKKLSQNNRLKKSIITKFFIISAYQSNKNKNLKRLKHQVEKTIKKKPQLMPIKIKIKPQLLKFLCLLMWLLFLTLFINPHLVKILN